VESLETRLVPTTLGNISFIGNIGPVNIGPANPGTSNFKHVILDFDGGLISDQEMMEGGWPLLFRRTGRHYGRSRAFARCVPATAIM